MINILFYIFIGTIAYAIASVVKVVDSMLVKKKLELDLKEKGLSKTNWFLKYELYRKGVKGNAEETGSVSKNESE